MTRTCLAILAPALLASLLPAAPQDLRTRLISRRSTGASAENSSSQPALSADGRFIAFQSQAFSLVPEDGNMVEDIFVRDRLLNTTERVSVSSLGAEADLPSRTCTISGDGRYVSFVSHATNLVPGDTNGLPDAFLHDRSNGTTWRLSVAADGTQADGATTLATLSADGRFAAIVSSAGNLVPGDTNQGNDVFVIEVATGAIERISLAPDGSELPAAVYGGSSLSADGRWVTIDSDSGGLTLDDDNGERDVFLHDRMTGTTQLVSRNDQGAQGGFQARISGDGRFVAFGSRSTRLVQETQGLEEDFRIFVFDRLTGTTRLESVSLTSDTSGAPSGNAMLSASGRFIAFHSDDVDLTPGDDNGYQDVYLRDRALGRTIRTSVSTTGINGDWDSVWAQVSAAGDAVAYQSFSTTLDPDDTNPGSDIFVTDVDRIPAESFCAGDGLPCPCGNQAGYAEGCANSSGRGGRLFVDGSASVAADDLSFQAQALAAGSPALLFTGVASGAVFLGDGLSCLTAPQRLQVRFADALGTVRFDAGLAGQLGLLAGQSQAFQVHYRDPVGSACGSSFNLTSAVLVTYLP